MILLAKRIDRQCQIVLSIIDIGPKTVYSVRNLPRYRGYAISRVLIDKQLAVAMSCDFSTDDISIAQM